MDNRLWQGSVANKLKCDHCGEIIDSGIMNVVNHTEVCGGNITVKINDNISATYSPYISFSPIFTDTEKQTKSEP